MRMNVIRKNRRLKDVKDHFVAFTYLKISIISSSLNLSLSTAPICKSENYANKNYLLISIVEIPINFYKNSINKNVYRFSRSDFLNEKPDVKILLLKDVFTNYSYITFTS